MMLLCGLPAAQLAREVCLHMRSCHPYIASLYAAYKDSGHIYLLMELAPSGNLYQMLMSLQVPVVRLLPPCGGTESPAISAASHAATTVTCCVYLLLSMFIL